MPATMFLIRNCVREGTFLVGVLLPLKAKTSSCTVTTNRFLR